MPIAMLLPDNYGYVALIALGVVPILAFGQGYAVSSLRRKAGVPYPNAYASHDQAKNNKAAYKFNCAQRAHANLLENMSQTVAMMLFAGLFYPTAAAGLGAGWVLCRIAYAYGYINSETEGKGRSIGSGQYIMLLGLLGCTVSGALKLI